MLDGLLSSAGFLSSGGTIGGDLTISGDLTVSGDSSGAYSEIITDGLQITKDTDGEFVSLILVNQSDAADTTGIISQRFDLEDTGGTAVDSGKILVGKEASFTATSSTQDSYMAFQTSLNGSLAEKVRITSAGNVGIGASPSTTLHLTNTANDATAPELRLQNTRAGGAGSDGDDAGTISFYASDAGSNSEEMSTILSEVGLNTTGSTAGKLTFKTMAANSSTALLTLNGWAGGSHNSTVSSAIISTDLVGIGTTAPDTLLHLYSTSASKPILKIENEQGGANPVSIQLLRNTSSPADDDFIGQIDFRSMNDAGTPEEINYAYITGQSTDITDGTEDGELQFYTMKAGTSTNTMTMQSGNVGIGQSSPDGKLHIESGSAGTIGTLSYADELILENSGAVGISLRSPDANSGSIVWQSDTNDTVARIYGSYNSGNELLAFETSGTERMKLDDNSRISLSNNDSGTSNTVFGYGAGMPTGTNSNNNVIIGHQTFDLVANDGAVGNVFVGYRVARGNPTSDTDHNVGVGYVSLSALTSGDSNICIGSSAGVAITEEHNVIAIGRNAAATLNDTGADGTVAIGRDAFTALTTGAGNVAIGYQSADAMTVGQKNVVVGHQAMSAAVEDGGCVAVGWNALLAANGGGSDGSATNTYNTAVGYNAGAVISTGLRNTIVGGGAGPDFDAENNNTLIGAFVASGSNAAANLVGVGANAIGGANLTSGANGTVAIGESALTALTSGAENVAMGYQAMAETTQGDKNTVVGYQAMAEDATLGNTNNTFLGYQAGGGDWTTGASSYNVGIGSKALYGAMNDADYNVAIGSEAGIAVVGGEHNTMVGNTAGNVITSGTQNTIIGSASDPSANSGTNQSVIGYATTGVADNSVTLGNASVTAVYMSSDSQALVHSAGIQFAGTQVANAGANVFDDYEEGTYTITCTCATSGTVTINTSDNELQYTKIGRVVHVQGKIRLASVSSPVGNLQWSLPFAVLQGVDESGMAAGTAIPYDLNIESGMTSLACSTAEGTSYFYMVEFGDDTGWDMIEGSDVDGNEIFNVGLTYVT